MLSINYFASYYTQRKSQEEVNKKTVACCAAIDFICITAFVAGILLSLSGVLHLSLHTHTLGFLGKMFNLIPGGKVGSGLLIGGGVIVDLLSIALPLIILALHSTKKSDPIIQTVNTYPLPDEDASSSSNDEFEVMKLNRAVAMTGESTLNFI